MMKRAVSGRNEIAGYIKNIKNDPKHHNKSEDPTISLSHTLASYKTHI